MRNIEEIKTVLREIQGNFNPEKETYKLIDEVVNSSLSSETAFKKLCEIKGVKKYPETLRNKYIKLMEDLQEIVIEDRKKEERKRQEENTKELRDIIANLEHIQNNKKRVDKEARLANENVVFEDNSDVSDGEEKTENLENDNVKLQEIGQEEKSKIEEEVNKDEQETLSLTEDDENKDKKLFLFFLAMVIFTFVVGIFIFLFF